MKHLLAIFAFIFTLTFISGCDKHGQDREVIGFIFAKNFEACAEHNGATFADLQSTQTIEYYTRIHKLALTGKKADLLALPLLERYEVLLARQLGKRSELKDLDGKGYAEWAITNGLWDYIPEPDEDLDLGYLTFNGAEAVGTLEATVQRRRRVRFFGTQTVTRHEKTPYTVRFVLESGQWKYDNTNYNQAIRRELESIVKDTKKEENAALIFLVGEATSQPVPSTIWNSMPH